MFVVGTAGHVDHGKSALVKALTGIDPDRLREEKERGMTIDLGFAWLGLPSGREVSIVDVPGHERFIKNMLAGVGGIDVALLVVAADESVMPQTEEHLAILDLLRVKNGLVAITKIDLVEQDWLELVISDVKERLKGTVLESVPLVAVSALTGQGLEALVQELDRLLEATPPKRDLGQPRLPVDRVFTIAGFGTVVTGTLIDGRFQVGQEVEVQPKGLKSRIRGLQTHKHKVEVALPGTRVAMNLAGLATTELTRGDVVTTPRWLVPTVALDARLRLLASAPRPMAHNAAISFHTGAAEAIGRVRLLDRPELRPSETGWAQVRLDRPLAVAKGDLFIVRTPETTIGGGEVVNPHPKRHKRFQARVVQSLEALARGGPEEVALEVLRGRPPMDPAALAQRSGLAPGAALAALNRLVAQSLVVRLGEVSSSKAGADSYFVSAQGWEQLREQIGSTLAAYHRQYPLRAGLPKEQLRSRLNWPARPFALALERLAQEGLLSAEEGALARLAGHRVEFTPQQQVKIERLWQLLAQNPYAPPGRAEFQAALALEDELVNALVEQGRLCKLTEDILFPAETYQKMVRQVVGRIQTQGRITVAEVRDMFNTSRKYALALMEHLDEAKVTRRVGDERVLR